MATAAPDPLRADLVRRTARLWLLGPGAVTASAMLDYERRNEAHLSRWGPAPPPGALTLAAQALRRDAAVADTEAGRAYRFWLVRPEAAAHIAGSVHFSNVVLGVFRSCTLGYAIDAALEGQGLLAEALAAALDEVFSPRIGLHRVQAAVQPDNLRSLAVLRRLGFEPIGLARGYLFIGGAWRDHLLWQRLAPAE